MDWTNILASEFVEEEKMSTLAAGFPSQMRKGVEDSEDESTPISNGNHPRRSSTDEKA